MVNEHRKHKYIYFLNYKLFSNFYKLDAFMDTGYLCKKMVKVTGPCCKVAGFCLGLINYNGIRSVHRIVYSRRLYPRDF